MTAVAFFFIFLSSTLNAATLVPFEELDSILKKHQLQSIDELAPLLPQAFKENWTAAFVSRGLAREFTSPEDPRIISFSPVSGLVITYSNCAIRNPQSLYANCDALEAIQYDRSKNSFELRIYEFPGPQRDKKYPVKVESNPARCMACHDQNPKPLWEPYNFWPGVYGSISDKKHDYVVKDTQEHRDLKKFLGKHFGGAHPSPRYSELKVRELDEKESLMPLAFGSNPRPNVELSNLFNRYNFERVAKLMLNNEEISRKKYLLAWWTKCLDTLVVLNYNVNDWYLDQDMDSLYSEDLVSIKPFDVFQDQLEARFRKDYQQATTLVEADALETLFREKDQIYYSQAAASLLRLLEIFELPSTSLNTSFKFQELNHTNSEFGVIQFQNVLKAQIKDVFPELMGFSCKDLREQSQINLK